MKKVFEIREFSLVQGKVFYTYLERDDLFFDERTASFRELDGTFQPQRSKYYSLTNNISNLDKNSLFPAGTEILPYKAKVIQDLPLSVSKFIEPQEYNNCQLMGEKYGGYLQFKNLDNGEVLLIALNSNYYEPID